MLDAMKWRYRLADARALLETERRLLQAGAMKELSALDPRRRALAANLDDMPEEAARAHQTLLAEIRRGAARNQRLLKAYVAGAADALGRLRAMDESRAEIGAYRQDGTKLPIKPAGPRTERRA